MSLYMRSRIFQYAHIAPSQLSGPKLIFAVTAVGCTHVGLIMTFLFHPKLQTQVFPSNTSQLNNEYGALAISSEAVSHVRIRLLS